MFDDRFIGGRRVRKAAKEMLVQSRNTMANKMVPRTKIGKRIQSAAGFELMSFTLTPYL